MGKWRNENVIPVIIRKKVLRQDAISQKQAFIRPIDRIFGGS